MPVMLLSTVPTNTSARRPISSSTNPSTVLDLGAGRANVGKQAQRALSVPSVKALLKTYRVSTGCGVRREACAHVERASLDPQHCAGIAVVAVVAVLAPSFKTSCLRHP